ncbi:LacI family DNA-binding transcriptional regulator [Proteiniborus sp.]|uniref:LacI family DNA-binding transcriptional regulator n=1 Tax=Proteiniborus sp. TaxID=2079015 RepID=UPI003330FF40
MEKIITIKDVAECANVSISTVSRVLNGKTSVKPELKKAVWKAVEQLNYKPNAAARFMKGQKTGTIGLLVPDIANPFYSGILAGAITRAQDSYHTLMVSSSNGSLDQEKKSLEHLSRSVLDGLIYCPVARNEAFTEIEYFKNIPVVIAFRRNIISNRPHVYADNIKGGYIATKYMLRLKRKRICFLAGFWNPPCDSSNILKMSSSPESGFYTTLDRFKGYIQALEEEGIPFDPSLVFICKYDHISGYNAAKKVIADSIDIDGLLAPNDLVASGVIKLLSEQGISVPHDISVIGYDDGLIAPIITPSLTSVKQSSEEIGVKSVDLMLNLLDGKEVNDYVVDVSLSIRNSTSFLKNHND